MLGADTIVGEGKDSGVVNKSGSLLLSLAAAHYQVPIMVISSVLKAGYAPECEDEVEEKEVEEVIGCYESVGGWGDTTQVRNVYFDKVPMGLVTYLVTEEGALKDPQSRMEEVARQRREDYEGMFYH